MNKLCLLLLFSLVSFLFATKVNAQTDRGSFMIGGELGFSTATSTVTATVNGNSTTSPASNASQFNIAPSIGYFFANNFAVGIGVDYTLNLLTKEEERRLNSDLLFGPFVRYYVPFGDDKALFFEADFGYGNSANSTKNNSGANQNILTHVFALGVGPGFTIFSNDAIGIEALAKYNFISSNTIFEAGRQDVTSASITNAFDFSVGLQVYLTRVQPAN